MEILEVYGAVISTIQNECSIKVEDSDFNEFFICHRNDDYALQNRSGDQWWAQHNSVSKLVTSWERTDI